MEFGQLPVLEVGGKFLAQSVAVLRYVGIKYGYYPTENPELCWRIDSTIDSLGDVLNAFYKASFYTPEDQKEAAFKQFYSATLPSWLGVMNKRLQ